jgi:hypothetical protein
LKLAVVSEPAVSQGCKGAGRKGQGQRKLRTGARCTVRRVVSTAASVQESRRGGEAGRAASVATTRAREPRESSSRLRRVRRRADGAVKPGRVASVAVTAVKQKELAQRVGAKSWRKELAQSRRFVSP